MRSTTRNRALGALLCLLSAPAFAQQSAPGQMGPAPGAASPPALSPLSPAPAIPLPTPTPGVAPAVPAPAPGAGVPQAGAPASSAPQTAAPKPKPKPPIREWALSSDPTPSFQPETFFATAKASERYAQIVDAGGWPNVPGAVGPGSRGPAVAALRKRLAVEGDPLEAVPPGDVWDAQLAGAVKHFQARNGLRETGVVAGATLRAINVPARIRFKQLA